MKMWNYVVISVFLALIFEMAGMSVASSLLSNLGINLETGAAGFKSGTFWIALVLLLTTATIAGITIGFFTKVSSENFVILPFVVAEILIFSSVMLGILSIAQDIGGWVFSITLLIMTPLIIGFGVAAYEHFRGTD